MTNHMKDMLCLGLNPNCSSRSSPRSFTTCKILASRIFSNNLLIGPIGRGHRWILALTRALYTSPLHKLLYL